MFHAMIGRFQLELLICITYFSTVIPLTSCVFFLVGLSQESAETLRPVENVALKTKGPKEKKKTQLVSRMTVENR